MKFKLHILGYVPVILFVITILTSYIGIGGDLSKKDRMKKSGWIGVQIQDVTEKMARKAKINSEEGVYIKEVLENSPADSAGIKEGDIIIEFNGKRVLDSDDLVKMVGSTLPGTKVSILVIHDGDKKTIELTVGRNKRPGPHMFNFRCPMPQFRFSFNNRILGLQILTLNEQLGEYFGAPNNEGVLVEEVEKESPAEKAGFKAGDIIVRVGKKTINKAEKIRKELNKYDEGDKVEFEILRKGAKKTLNVEIKEDQTMEQNFFFNGPHFQRFNFEPSDDAGLNMEMDDFQPKMENFKRELEEKMEKLRDKQKDIQERVQRSLPPQFGGVNL